MRSEPFNLLYYTKVRWLSEGNVVARVFELQEELEKFLIMQKQHELRSKFKDNAFISRLSYLVDIFDQLSLLNLKLQGKGTTIIDFIDTLNAFVQKLENWTRKAEKGNFAAFEILSTVSSNDMDDALSSEILVYLTSLQKEFSRYFPEISESDLKLVRKPFGVPVEVCDDLQDELIYLKNYSTCRDMFDTLSICEFWAKMCSYTSVSLKNASQSCHPSVAHIYANQGFPSNVDEKLDSKPIS